MKNWIIIALLFTVSFGAKAGTFEKDLETFTSIRAAGNYKVILKKGDVNKAEIANDDEDVDDDEILLDVVRDELRVRLKADIFKERDIEIVITYKELNLITAKKGCRVVFDTAIEKDKMEFVAESGGKIKAEVKTKKVIASISAGGSIHLKGTTAEAAYNVSAGGTIGAVSLDADKVVATVKAGGEIICTVVNDLNIKITSGGNVSYYGDPGAFEQKITLGGKIIKMNKTH
ncbi:MAG: hypothetical protein GQ574_20755 [Crocinitomix sp.]|nr:hypothetical protein [Crocinitomix sp.]